MKIYRSTLLHTPASPFAVPDALQTFSDGALAVGDTGTIAHLGTFTEVLAEVRAACPDAEVHDLRGGVLLPGFIDTHVHYPQVRVLGGLGMALLEWLDRNTLPEEARLADAAYARTIAGEFLHGLASHGTTTALVFGSHFAGAMDEFFAEAAARGLRVVAGQVVSDRLLRPELHTTPERAYAEGKALIERWHGQGRSLYAVTPRFSLSASEGILDACAALLTEFPDVRFTSHINENNQEIEVVRGLFPGARDYLDTYERAGLVTPRSVFAHNVHPNERELGVLAAQRCSVAHCPCSNSALGSGLFPLRRHLAAGVHVALGTDVGGGTGFSLLKEGLQAYFMQQLLGEEGAALSPAHLLYLATLAGAQALGLDGQVGDFTPGKQFDAVWLRPRAGSTLATVLAHAESEERTLAALFALGTGTTWSGCGSVGGWCLRGRQKPERQEPLGLAWGLAFSV
ncbi:guanine deaminase [Deinococcus radiodurans R1 = ATCC 13939 = DSM 20539]|uniref:guanine deaminase n=1 Tax=Deinococcus radiodurans TaxID=1299 RepID=UPI001F1B8B65|nr:guanine deaminase [Deinococcus radiodurans]UID71767.1 guanine deaminase [Deinococcus radiodurans R1 = ATCC 13939 = DSM 20539]